jgi:hypothetical protein
MARLQAPGIVSNLGHTAFQWALQRRILLGGPCEGSGR